MGDAALTTTEALVRQYAPEMVPDPGSTRLATYSVSILSAFLLAMGVIGGFRLVDGAAWSVLLTMLAVSVPLAEFAARKALQREVDRFHHDLAGAPWRLYENIAAKFEQEILRQRMRTIGPESDWGRARRPLDHAAHEAARSVAYWEERCAVDSDNDMAQQQRDTARQLHGKFQGALSELDARAQVLVNFFNQCEARLAVLNSAKRDAEEVRKLGVLSETAEDVVSDAQETLRAIGENFLAEAIRVGNALGGLERVGWLSLVDTVQVAQIETLADRILESSEREREMVDKLTQSVLG